MYKSRFAVPDLMFEIDTNITLIPGLKEVKLPPRLKYIYKRNSRVFTKTLTADKSTAFDPVILPLIPGKITSQEGYQVQIYPATSETHI